MASPSSSLSPDSPPLHVIDVLKGDMGTAFDLENKAHCALLTDIWNHLLAPDPPPSPLSPHVRWKEVGFQRDTPESDLRGAGVLGLRHFAYLATRFTPELIACIERQKERTEKHYPVATAAINVTRMICVLLGVTKAMSSRPVVTECCSVLKEVIRNEQDACHLHARLFLHLDREYVENPNSSYLLFNEISERVRDDVESAALALFGTPPGDWTVDRLMREVSEQRNRRRKGACLVA
eukprot:TRINITY_DN9596_c0_g1_i1.p1 TRINITY_DN9596_c0_g1~~TRINITY_DN9596_c0_g1_i1.p1  ORF type:complete len:237 (-),score=51.09 TRINITY_DN9596_c0_g1_i1:94-804(-)